ncbi:hypothetical protein JHK82_043193 [Glycine max]|nr:hypothetical protein JHK87_043128 [Glycine soja]KAG5106223.1 hypothetical protein JHK82_043193 [Glycine max]
MIVDRVYPCVQVWDAAEKKGFELYYKAKMASRKMKIVWMDSQKASTFGNDGSDIVVPRNVFQALQPTRKYLFDDACVYFTKDVDNYSFIQRLLQLPFIPYQGTYNLKKMTKAQMIAHVTKIHEVQQKRRVDVVTVEIVAKEVATTVQAEAFGKVMDDTVVCGVLIDLTNTSDMDKTSEASNVAIADGVEPLILAPVSKQSTNSNEAISQDKGDHDVVIVYSTNYGPTPLNYAQPTIITRDQVQYMIGQAMESFVERQRQENGQFFLSMQNAITMQFSNLGVILLQNIQQAQLSMLGAIVASVFQPASLEPSP